MWTADYSNEHYLSSKENKAWKNSGLYGIWTHACMTSAMPVQRWGGQYVGL